MPYESGIFSRVTELHREVNTLHTAVKVLAKEVEQLRTAFLRHDLQQGLSDTTSGPDALTGLVPYAMENRHMPENIIEGKYL